MIEHRCMVPIIKWYYNSPDNSTIKVIKVRTNLHATYVTLHCYKNASQIPLEFREGADAM